MAGNLNSPSVIWVAGDTAGRDASGNTVAIPGDILATVSGVAGLATETYVDSAIDVLHDRLVASGILES